MSDNKEMGVSKEYDICGEKITLKPLSADFAHLAFDLAGDKTRNKAIVELMKETYKASGYDFSTYNMSIVSDATVAVLDINGLNKE